MNFLLLTYEYPPFHGGVATYLGNLMKAAPESVSLEVEVIPKGEHWIKSTINQLYKVKSRHTDLFAISHVLPVGYVAWIQKLFTGTPYIVFTHGTDILSAKKSAWKRFWMRFVLRRARLVIANSRFTAGLLKEEGINRAEIVPPSIVVFEKLDTISRSNWNSKRIISIGRLVERKGFDTGIKALSIVRKEFPDVTYTIIGNGPYLETLEKIVANDGLQANVHILTKIDDQEKLKELDKASIFILPARAAGADIEGFGIVTLEASAAGLPVVVGRSGGAPEGVIDGVTGIVIEPNDPKSLADAISRLFSNPGEARKMGEEGRKYVNDEYAIEKFAKRFWDLIAMSSSRAQRGISKSQEGSEIPRPGQIDHTDSE